MCKLLIDIFSITLYELYFMQSSLPGPLLLKVFLLRATEDHFQKAETDVKNKTEVILQDFNGFQMHRPY